MLASHSAAASAPHASGGAKLVFSSQARRAAGVVARRAAPRQRLTVMAAAPAASGPQLMINSVTGKMGQAVAEAAVRAGVEVIPFSLCSPSEEGQTSVKVAGHSIELVGAKGRDEAIQRLKSQYPRLLMVDYTVPDVIHQQAATYIRNATPFVMGTTGGDRAKLLADVQAAGLYAVIAPQMGKQVVAFQATMEAMATSFPGAFSGYKLEVVESHQSTKKDTSGTAKAIVSSFERLGASFDGNIVMVRDKESQTRDMKVPEKYLSGHAYHTYRLRSPDGSVYFEFQHNVCGRAIYAEGTVDAALFLARQVAGGAGQRVYNMIDVLRAGAMR